MLYSIAIAFTSFILLADVGTSATRQQLKSPAYGGSNGTTFDDVMNVSMSGVNVTGICFINISSGNQVDAIQVTYLLSNGSLYQSPVHGKYNNPPITIVLDPDEYVTKLEGKTNGALVDQLTLTTVGPDYEHKVYGPFGKTGNLSFTFEDYILGFHGRSGNLLDSIGIYSLELVKKSQEFGGPGGDPFDDRVDGRAPPIVGISKIFIWHANIIGAFQIEYILLGDSTVLGELHGWNSSPNRNLTTVSFDKGEQLIEVHGKVGDGKFVYQMTFITKKEGGGNAQYGPFGVSGNELFSFFGNIYGFFGHSGSMVDRIGMYYL